VRSALLRQGNVVVVEVPDPVPAFGQVLCRTLACGICGSDLHFVHHGKGMQELTGSGSEPGAVDFDRIDLTDVHRVIVNPVKAELPQTGPQGG
jgi:NADPH:quinone reductase-like Zn-dependent oxidoreductase